MKAWSKLGLLILLGLSPAQALTSGQEAVLFGKPGWVLPGATLDLNFSTGQYYTPGVSGVLTNSRASVATTLLPTSVQGAAYVTVGSNVNRIVPGLGLLVEESRTNYLLNSAAPATQTTGSLGTGTYVLWVNGSGNATMSAGTAIGCGSGVATQGTPVNVVITVAGTCTVTVGGSLNVFQLELSGSASGPWGTSFIATAGTTLTRAADVITTPIKAQGSYCLRGTGTPLFPTSYGLNQVIGRIDDGTTNNGVQEYRNTGTSNPIVYNVIGGSATTLSGITGGPWAQATAGRIAEYAAPLTVQGTFNGAGGQTSATSGLAAGINELVAGSAAGIAQWNGWISRLTLEQGSQCLGQ